MVLAIISTAGMRVKISKSKFLQNKWNIWHAVSPDKVFNLYVTRLRQSLTLRRPKQEKNNNLRQFIGIVNYYRDKWFRRSELLAPLTSLTSSKVKLEWHSSHQQAFDKIKRVIGTEVLLCFPDFNNFFDLYTDASGHQLGAVSIQDKRQNNYSLLFAKAQYSSKAVYNHQERVVISY
jgi:hypothetical protein